MDMGSSPPSLGKAPVMRQPENEMKMQPGAQDSQLLMPGKGEIGIDNTEEVGKTQKMEVKRNLAVVTTLHNKHGRKRKGSLRQGLLGSNMLRRDPQSGQSQSKQTQLPSMSSSSNPSEPPSTRFHMAATASHSDTMPRGSSPDLAPPVPDSRSSSEHLDKPTPRVLTASATRPEPPSASTTDDDEALSFYRRPVTSESSFNAYPLPTAGPTHLLSRRRLPHASQTALPSVPVVNLSLDTERSDSDTEWWGWVILMSTWIIFVVGMGSCLGVWSWAWDVGETPYAPPELEDDPTLPITGYYPALMVCTAVMAWVWVVVAWVGMKYFRHAKMASDDS